MNIVEQKNTMTFRTKKLDELNSIVRMTEDRIGEINEYEVASIEFTQSKQRENRLKKQK